MLNRLLGIDNCIGCKFNIRLADERYCSKYKKFLIRNYYGVPLKPKECDMPFKHDLTKEN